MGGGEHSDYNIEGIGNDFIADTMDILKLTPDSLVIGDSIRAYRYCCIGEQNSTSGKKSRRRR